MKKNMFLFFLLLLTGANANPDSNQPYDQLNSEFQTEHIDWAENYCNGPLKILVIGPTWTQRETVELAERTALKYSPLMTYDFNNFDGSKKKQYMEVQASTVKKTAESRLADNHDVIIIGKMKWDALPNYVRLAIIKKVYYGTGLVYICPPTSSKELEKLLSGKKINSDGILKTVPVNTLPIFKNVPNSSIISITEFGKGKIAVLNYPQDKSNPFHGLSPVNGGYEESHYYYDYYLSLVSKLVLAVSCKKTDAIIGELHPDTGANRLKVRIEGDSDGKNMSLEIKFRDRKNVEKSFTEKIFVKKGANEYNLSLPSLKNGFHFVDAKLMQNEKDIDWASSSFETTRPEKVARISLAKQFYKPDEAISGEIELSENVKPEYYLQIEAIDTFKKIVKRSRIECNRNRTIHFNLGEVGPGKSNILEIRASLTGDSGVVDQESSSVIISRTRDMKDFYFVAWLVHENNSYVNNYIINKALSKYGTDIGYVPFTSGYSEKNLFKKACILAENNMGIIPYATSLIYYKKDPVKDLTRSYAFLKKQAEILKPFSPYAYSLGDENGLSLENKEVLSEKSLAGFRDYLKKEYASLKELNKEWDSDYKSWEEVKPSMLQEVLKNGNYPSWVDFRVYMENVFTKLNINAVTEIKEVDQEARLGAEGLLDHSSFTGYDFYNLITKYNMFVPYPKSYQIEFSKSFLPDNSISGTWYGSYLTFAMSEDIMRFTPWWNLFYGFNSCWWWTSMSPEGVGGASALTPGMTPLPGVRQTMEEINEIKSGIGKALLSAKRSKGAIRIYHSDAFMHASTMKHDKTDLINSWNNFFNTLYYLQYDFCFMAREELINGEQEKAEIKVLILPYAQAVSLEEAKIIRTFVKNGGLVIADFDPGIMDSHGKRYEKSCFAEMFGKFEKGFVNNFGKGKTLYLGTYEKMSDPLEKFLTNCNIIPEFIVSEKSGNKVKNIKTAVFKDNAISYLYILPEKTYKETKECSITVPQKRHIYDVRKKSYIGNLDNFNVQILTLTPGIYAMLPEKIQPEKLSLEKSAVSQGESLAYHIKAEGDKQRIPSTIRIELTSPSGATVAHYSQNIRMNANEYNGTFRTAFNEEKGKWKISINNIISGEKDEEYFEVR